MTPREVLEKHIEENNMLIGHINSETQRLWKEQSKLVKRLDTLKKEKERLLVENDTFQLEIMKMGE